MNTVHTYLSSTPASFFRILFASILLAFFVSGIATSNDSYTQTPLKLKASDVLPKDLLAGDNYTINEDVVNDGIVNLFTLKTDYGDLEAEGQFELNMRIAELQAMSVMEEMERNEIFGDALKEGAKAPFKGVANLVTEPIETGKSAAQGIGQFFSNVGRSFVSDDPDQANPVSALVGYDVAKRQFAYELGINPYTDNEFVNKELGKISRAAVAGGLTPRAAMATIDSTAVTVARVTGTTKAMRELVRDNPPGKLDKINREKLEAMGVSSALAEEFLDNYHFDPFEETLLVGELEALNIQGRDKFIEVAMRASEKSVARYYRLMAQMIGAYNRNIGNVKEIRSIKNVAYLIQKDFAVIILAPVDYVFWTPGLEKKLQDFESVLHKTSKPPRKEIWVTGKFDDVSQKQFEDHGWKVVNKATEELSK